MRLGGPRSAIDLGIAYVPEDRHAHGVAPSLSIAQNPRLKTYRRSGFVVRPSRRCDARARDLIERYDVRAPGPDTPAGNSPAATSRSSCSGASCRREPRVLVAASPTRGLDVGAIETVHGHLRRRPRAGSRVLLFSEDLDEVLALADRVR